MLGQTQITLNSVALPMTPQAVDVIIPVYNEEEALPAMLEQLLKLPVEVHPIFIDNGSTDNSLAILDSLDGVTVIRHRVNRGYGASLRAGINRSTSDKIIIIDADGEYSPQVIPALLEALDRYEVVHTSRFIGGENHDITWVKYAGNRLITTIFNFLFRQKLTDLYTGCKGYQRQRVASLEMKRNGFEHVLEVSARLVRQSVQIKEVPVRYQERKRGVSKMNHVLETAKYLGLVVYYALTLSRREPGAGG